MVDYGIFRRSNDSRGLKASISVFIFLFWLSLLIAVGIEDCDIVLTHHQFAFAGRHLVLSQSMNLLRLPEYV